MPRGQVPGLFQELRRLAGGPADDLTDRQLLQRYADRRDEAAFAELVRRHGRLVLGVCWRILHDARDTEDAFQATFLVLARKAGSVPWRDSVSNWLYQAACRLSAELRRKAARQRTHERRAAEMRERRPPAQPEHEELARVIDFEIQRLPQRLRAPLLLCYLEGHPVDQAARQLGWSLRTTERRLQQGRDRLRGRLARRGLSLSAPLIAAALAQDAAAAIVSADLADSTVRLARHFAPEPARQVAAPARAMVLARGMLRGTGIMRTKVLAALLAGACLLAGGGAAVLQAITDPEPSTEAPDEPMAAAQPMDSLHTGERVGRVDRYGDTLPPGASARMGTVRYRVLGALAFDASGKTYAFGSDRGVMLGDIASGRIDRCFPGNSRAWGVAFSADGTTLAANEDNWVEIWDIPTGRKLHSYRLERVSFPHGLVFSPDGASVAADRDQWGIHVWDVKTGKELWRRSSLGDPSRLLTVGAFAPDGKTVLALEGRSNQLVALASATGELVRRFQGLGGNARLVFSPDLSLYATGPGNDWSLHIHDTATGRELHRLSGFASTGEGFAFSPDSKALAWCSQKQGCIRLVDVASGKVTRRVASGLKYPSEWLHFLPDGKTLLFCPYREETLHYWDLERDQEVHPPGGHRGGVGAVCYTPDGRQLVSASVDETVRFWDPVNGRELERVLAHSQGAWCLAPAPDGKTVASGSLNDGEPIRIWDTTTRKEIRHLDVHAPVQCMTFSPSGTSLLWGQLSSLGHTAGGEPAVYAPHLWDVATGKEIRRYQIDGGSGCPATYSPDGKYLASQSGNSLLVWQAASGRAIRQMPLGRNAPFPHSVTAAAFSPDGRMLFTAERDSSVKDPVIAVRFWELASGKERLSLPYVPEWYCPARYSPDGRFLAFAEIHHDVCMLDVATGQLVRRFAGHDATIESLDFAPDGKHLASAGMDTTILVWDLSDLTARIPKPPANLSERELEALWNDLASDDAARAYRAIGALAASPARSVDLLRRRLHPPQPPDAGRLARLIAALDDDQFAVREKAVEELSALGEWAEAPLRVAQAGKSSAESRRRIAKLLDEIAAGSITPETLRAIRAVELLERLATPPARELLRTFAAGTPGTRLTREAQETLQRLARANARPPSTPDGQ